MKKILKMVLAISFMLVSLSVLPAKAAQIYDIDINVTSNQEQAQVMLKLINEERAKVGVAPLKWSNELEDSANLRSSEIAAYYSHTRPDGSSCLDVNEHVHGENIAAGQVDAEAVMKSWMNSPGHRSNILNPEFKSIGVGSIKIGETPYWVQLFSYDNLDDKMQTPVTGLQKRTIQMNSMNVQDFSLNINGHFILQGSTFQVYLRIGNEGWEGHCVPLAGDSVNWTSSDDSIVSVDSNGVLKGKSAGIVKITATHKKYPFITATGGAGCKIPSFTLNKTSTKVAVGQPQKISVNNNSLKKDQKIIWSSSDPSVAKVDQTGTVTGLKEGNAVIYADRNDVVEKAEYLMKNGYSKEDAYYYSRLSFEGATANCNVKVILPAPRLNLQSSKGNITLSWNKIKDASGYNIYRYNQKKKTYERITWTKGTTITLQNEPMGVTNNYRVKAYYKDSTVTISSNYSNLEAAKLLETTKLNNAVQTSSNLTLKWSAVGGSTGYSIYRYDADTKQWNYLGASQTTDYIDKTAKSGVHYQYKILPYAMVNKKAYYGPYSNVSEGINLKKTNIITTSVKSSIGKISFSWAKSAGATGYNVYRFNKNTNKWETLKSVTKGESFTDTGMPYQGVCYYKVRPYYKTKDGKVLYGEYSSQLGIKSK